MPSELYRDLLTNRRFPITEPPQAVNATAQTEKPTSKVPAAVAALLLASSLMG